MMVQLRLVYIILLGLLTLQACTSQPTDGSGKDGWLDNLNEAQTQSVKVGKSILVSFTNSDTCGMCKQLETNVFSSPAFKAWAEKSVVLMEVDFSEKNPISQNSKNQNEAMAQSLKVTTFPTIWILNIDHEPENNRFKVKPIGTIGYQDTPEKFIGLLQNLIRK
jgi:thioredoxin-related protein